MEFYRRQAQLLCDLGVLDLSSGVDGQTLHPLGHVRRRGDGGSAAERLEFHVRDDSVLVDLDLKLHDVSACWSTDQPSPDVHVVLVERAHIPRVLVVIDDLCVVSSTLWRRRDGGGESGRTGGGGAEDWDGAEG